MEHEQLLDWFQAPLCKGEDFIKMPRWFYCKWGSFGHDEDFILTDKRGNRLYVGFGVRGNQPGFLYGVQLLRSFYDESDYLLMTFFYVGRNRFRIWVVNSANTHVAYPVPYINLHEGEHYAINSYPGEGIVYAWGVVLLSNHFSKRRPLVLPEEVTKEVINPCIPTIKLVDRYGKKTKCTLMWEVIGHLKCALGTGWYEFMRSNELKYGDVVYFYSFGSQKKLMVNIGSYEIM